MARKKPVRKRGRPRKEHAKSRCTTREGRRTGRDPIVEGAPGLLARRRRVARGRTDLEINAASVLFGHDLINRAQFDRLGEVTRWLRTMARAWGGHDGSVGGLWSAILAVFSARRSTDVTPAGVDGTRLRLARALGRLDGSRELVVQLAEGRIPPLVVHVLDDRLTSSDRNAIERLRFGLDRIQGKEAAG